MRISSIIRGLALWAFAAIAATPVCAADYEYVSVEAPFPMEPIAVYQFPDRAFSIADYGAMEAGTASDSACIAANTEAFRRAMAACAEAGGGRVVVPKGEWPCGPIHFRSNCELHLSTGATVRFSSNPADFLPAVEVSWEGLECMNYSPMVYAYQCANIAITGGGTLTPDMTTWRKWFSRPKPHLEGLKQLYEWGYRGTPVQERQIAYGPAHLRPHMVHFNQCRNVRLEGFKIRHSPFWTIHMYRCDGGLVRGLDVYAHGHNNDGIDIEMTRNFLIEDCVFDQGDDGVVIKSGRNHDAWRIGEPTENIVVRNCRVRNAHGLLVIGSEISGGIRNVYMHDCAMDDKVKTLFYIKTNHRRGAFIDNIRMERVSANRMERAFAIDTDVLYQWKDLVPTYKDSITAISNIYMGDVRCHDADGIYEINGDARLPVSNVTLNRIAVDTVRVYTARATNVNGLQTDVTWTKYLGKE